MPSRTNTILIIPKGKVPAGIIVTYGRTIAKIIAQKDETYHTRLTVAGDLVNFPGDVTSPTEDLITSKLIFNCLLYSKTRNSCVQT